MTQETKIPQWMVTKACDRCSSLSKEIADIFQLMSWTWDDGKRGRDRPTIAEIRMVLRRLIRDVAKAGVGHRIETGRLFASAVYAQDEGPEIHFGLLHKSEVRFYYDQPRKVKP